MLWFIGLQVTIRELWRIEIYMKETQVKNKLPKSCIFKDWHLADGSLGLRTQQYIAFSKRIKWDLSDALKYFAQTETDFLLASAENAKKKYFDILVTITSESVDDILTNDPICLIHSLSSIR